MTWKHELTTRGPVDYVALLDATWQGEPEWGEDIWVALDAAHLVSDGPPFPGVSVRVGVAHGEELRVGVRASVPAWAPLQVAESTLTVGKHGFDLEVGDAGLVGIELREGNYPLEVWVDPIAPGQARAVALVLGPRRPRRLPDRYR